MRENAERFEGLAEAYAAFRPGYPAGAIQHVAASVTSPLRRAVDLGAGPGNSTQSLRAALGPDWTVAAVEPGRDMRRVLTRRFEGTNGVMILDACAEALPLPTGFAAMAVVCSAWHWLDPTRTMAEAMRVLGPGGVFAVFSNHARPHPLLDAFDRYFNDRNPQGEAHQTRDARRQPMPGFLAQQQGFSGAQSMNWPWTQETDCRGLIDLWLTRATVWDVVRRIGLDRVLRDLRVMCDEHMPSGTMTLVWETRAQWVQRG